MTERNDDNGGAAAARAPIAADGGSRVMPVECKQIAELMGDYVDETLPAAEKDALDKHMAMCGPCVAFFRQYRFAPQAAREALLKAVPVDLENRLLSFLKLRCK